MGSTVEISSALVRRIMALARTLTLCEDGQRRLVEHCGILRGRGQRITSLVRARNVADAPETAFEIDPTTLLREHRASRRPGALQVLGYFHTHPSGLPDPSVRDAEDAAPDGKLWLIGTATQARLWRAVAAGPVHGRFEPVPFDLRTGKRIESGLIEVRHVDHGREHDVRIEEPRA